MTNNSGNNGEQDKMLIKLTDSDGSVLEFKVRPRVQFKKILSSFADNMGKDPNDLRLIYNGKVLQLSESPETMGMGNQVELEVVTSQTGGLL